MKRLAMICLFLCTCTAGKAARADEKVETLKPTVVEPYAEKNKVKVEASASDVAKATLDADSFQNTVCTQGKNRRLVELMVGDATAKKPCEVHYKKETEQNGHDQVIWITPVNMDTCTAKAKAFVTKLAGWGWTCGKAS